jgi:hypothetical protein
MSDVERLLRSAEELARAAAQDEAGEAAVGERLDFQLEGEGIASHLFACSLAGYRGWRWSVTLSVAPGSDSATIDEVVLLPGPDALLSPKWVPWSERVKPGDLGVGDVLPTPADDPRLVAGLSALDDLEGVSGLSPLSPGQWELGLGRERILSAEGLDLAAERWAEGEFGPDAAMAKGVPMQCSTCGFLVPIGGVLGQSFGVCANLLGPADGRLVSVAYGCGAHSQIAVDRTPGEPEGTAPQGDVAEPLAEDVQPDELDEIVSEEAAP